MSDLFDDLGDDFNDEPDYSIFEDDDDTFDQLRQRSARMDSGYDEEMESVMDDDVDDGSGGSRFSLGAFSPGQRAILALFVVLDIIMIGIGFLIWSGRIG